MSKYFIIHPIANYMKYLIVECYEKDYNPYTEFWNDYYCNEYSFNEWYFLYRKFHNLSSYKKIVLKYKHTPVKLLIGNDVLKKMNI
jgi:hypothetical protein